MKVFQNFISKLDSTEKHESNFGNLCMKKDGLYQKMRFLKSSMRGYATDTPPASAFSKTKNAGVFLRNVLN